MMMLGIRRFDASVTLIISSLAFCVPGDLQSKHLFVQNLTAAYHFLEDIHLATKVAENMWANQVKVFIGKVAKEISRDLRGIELKRGSMW
jgi:hypothetical protein